jgi:hypothetical protein
MEDRAMITCHDAVAFVIQLQFMDMWYVIRFAKRPSSIVIQ